MFSTGSARISAVERLVAELVGQVAALEKQLAAAVAAIERSSTVTIRADLDGLAQRVESLATSNRKEFGRLHAANRRDPTDSPEFQQPGDELAETLAFQRKWSEN